MKTNQKPSHKLKWIAVAFGLFAVLTYESVWQWKVTGGPEVRYISEWMHDNSALKRIAGDVESSELKRSRSKFYFGFNGLSAGRFHFKVKGSKATVDILVTWRKDRSDIVDIEKVASLSGLEEQTIWIQSEPHKPSKAQ
jgi:hypothetical protein